jgi:hypothetical protein
MEIGRCIQSDPTNGILYVDVIDHSFEGIRVSDEAYFSGNVTILGSSYVQLDQTVYGNVFATGQVLSSGIDILATSLAAANTTQVYANGALRVSNSALNFNNTSTIRATVTSGSGLANISFDLIGSSGIASFPVASGGSIVSANGLNFVNSATVGVTVSQGISGNANISFTTLAGGGTITQIDTGLGLSGGPITNSGTIRANVANTTVQGVTKLIDVVTSNDSANAATANSVKVAFDQATSAYGQANTASSTATLAYGQANAAFTAANSANSIAISAYGQANLAYTQANTANSIAISAYGQANAAFTAANNAANTVRVTANSGPAFSNVSLNFVNTATVQVSVTNPVSGIANIAFTSVGGTATPGGSNTQVQFNNNGTLGASANFTYNTAPNLVSLDANLKLAGSSNLYFGGEQANNSVANSKFRVSYNASAMSLDFTFLG